MNSAGAQVDRMKDFGIMQIKNKRRRRGLKKGILLVSVLCGVVFAVVSYLILSWFVRDAFLWAVFTGLLVCLVLFIFLHIFMKIIDKRYDAFEKRLGIRVWYRLNGNVRKSGGVKNVTVYFTDEMILFVSMDTNPRISDGIPVPEIERIETDYITQLDIFTKSGQEYSILSPDLEPLFPLLREHGLIAFTEF